MGHFDLKLVNKSEYEILSNFNFDEYDIKIITCEHNDTSLREKIHALLKKKIYKKNFIHFSLIDAWYVKV